jgi:hypothetical protein
LIAEGKAVPMIVVMFGAKQCPPASWSVSQIWERYLEDGMQRPDDESIFDFSR